MRNMNNNIAVNNVIHQSKSWKALTKKLNKLFLEDESNKFSSDIL